MLGRAAGKRLKSPALFKSRLHDDFAAIYGVLIKNSRKLFQSRGGLVLKFLHQIRQSREKNESCKNMRLNLCFVLGTVVPDNQTRRANSYFTGREMKKDYSVIIKP